MIFRHALVFLVLIAISGCLPRFVSVNTPELFSSYLGELEAYNTGVRQLKASADLRGLGFLGHRFRERVDIVALKPSYLLWSMRSFFESPSHIIASNGEYITAYDFSASGGGRFEKQALKNNSIIELFGCAFHPGSFVAIILAHVALENATQIKLARREHMLEYKANLPDNWQVRSLFDLKSKLLQESTYTNKKQEISYHVRYAQHALQNGVLFPKLFIMSAESSSQVFKFEFNLTQLELNGSALDPALFYLKSS